MFSAFDFAGGSAASILLVIVTALASFARGRGAPRTAVEGLMAGAPRSDERAGWRRCRSMFS